MDNFSNHTALLDLLLKNKDIMVDSVTYERSLRTSDHVVLNRQLRLYMVDKPALKPQHSASHWTNMVASTRQLADLDTDTMLENKVVEDTWKLIKETISCSDAEYSSRQKAT